MKWIAIDIGNSEVKVAVRDHLYKPVKLLYEHNGNLTSFLPSEAVVEGDSVYLGDDTAVFGALKPERIVLLSRQSARRNDILKQLFGKIKEAAVRHYQETDICAVLLYDNELDVEAEKMAATCFSSVQSMRASDVLSEVVFQDAGLSMIVDISDTALKVSVKEIRKKGYFNQSQELGFSCVELPDILGFMPSDNSTDTELCVYGLLFKSIKASLCSHSDLIEYNTFFDTEVDFESVRKRFDDKMRKFLFKCFEACGRALRDCQKNWNDVSNMLFCGGATNYYRMKEVFNAYLRGIGREDNRLDVVTYNRDAQWAAAFSTLQLNNLDEGDVVLEF